MPELTLFLAGDVMTGRGIDQILPSPGDPRLHESRARDAREYVALAESLNGPLARPVGPSWPWGEALALLDQVAIDVRILNLETSITRSDDFAPGKGIHYRMHPTNVACVATARPDVCVLANNHVLDFGRQGLKETLATLDDAGLAHVGAGRARNEATRPVVVPAQGRRVVVHAVGTESSGVPPHWAATDEQPGVAFLPELSTRSADTILSRLEKQPRDIVVVSVHAGSNWGYAVPRGYRKFAHRLVDGGVDVVHGHSSHHPRPIEVYRGRPILYGCGDLINDYEGIDGRDEFRSDLRLLYLVTLDADSRELRRLQMIPLQSRRLRLQRTARPDVDWLARTLSRISDIAVEPDEGRLTVRW